MEKQNFLKPSAHFGPVPFWWWVGDSLEPERLMWQLDQLKAKGILNTVISYNHHGDGSPNMGDPEIFSPQWWELFRWMVQECKKRGMKISFQDYTLLNPMLQKIGRENPGMVAAQLQERHLTLVGPCQVQELFSEGSDGWKAYAWKTHGASPQASPILLDVSSGIHNNALTWSAPEGEWTLCMVSLRSHGFDPMHPLSGAKALDLFYRPFEAHCPGELGKTIAVSFQDELDFGAGMPLWNSALLKEFYKRKNYHLEAWLPALWHDIGPITAKVRIDYNDVVTCLLEEHYFIPIFQWHEERGLLFGNDNCGRGAIRRGMQAYADPFRTMRWYSAPGTDDPKLDGPRAFKGIKVNSSIAHLYQRPRVWCEGFHSSGWGSTPAEIVAAINQDFIYGATVVNLHGLYYSTHGSWWEWAPPDFHFRQPYWEHTGSLSDYISRMCQTLALGVHVCDVAMVYPITALEAGLPPTTTALDHGEIAYSEMQGGHDASEIDESEAHAFGLGQHLIKSGIDFDYIDFQSLERAKVSQARLDVGGESYKVLLLPAMAAVRYSTLQVAREFKRQGGIVIAYGRLPIASDRQGSQDAQLDQLVGEIFGSANSVGTPVVVEATARQRGFIQGAYSNVSEYIHQVIVRDFIPYGAQLQCCHRRTASSDIYAVFNPSSHRIECECYFRAKGNAEIWDAWTGKTHQVHISQRNEHGSWLHLTLEPQEAQLLVFDKLGCEQRNPNIASAVALLKTIPLEGLWDFELQPTMNNAFGDFRYPAFAGCIGAEARQFSYCEGSGDNATWTQAQFDDTSWAKTTASYGQRFWKLGPIDAASDTTALQQCLLKLEHIDPTQIVHLHGVDYRWTPYEFSLRWGIENDPFMKDWASGPHGLKGQVAEEFIDLNGEQAGAVWFLWTSLELTTPKTYTFNMGSRSRYKAWINGEAVLEQLEELPPGRQSIWNLPHYRSTARHKDVTLPRGPSPLVLKLSQPQGQRIRAYAAFSFNEESYDLSLGLRWFKDPQHPVYNPRPELTQGVGWYRFKCPPGLKSMKVVAKTKSLRAWVGGQEFPVQIRDRKLSILEGCVECWDVSRESTTVVLRLEHEAGTFGGAAIMEPIALECQAGQAPLGDWCALGLATYSGAAWYRKTFVLDSELCRPKAKIVLHLGQVACTAEVVVNGESMGQRSSPPWEVDISKACKEGENQLEILVTNTLANHYSVGIPTPYVYDGQTKSGLIGPVKIEIYDSPTRGNA